MKGAFTDAREDRTGRFELAAGGTLFLDEIGNLSLPLQAKLLTALQNRRVTRVGTSQSVPVDIRLVCATNQPLREMVREGSFRPDLLYRINTVEITLPPLRERPEDLVLLATHFLEVYKRKYQKNTLSWGGDALRALRQYHWPGNVRELQHTVERAVILGEGNALNGSDLQLKDQVYEDAAFADSLRKADLNLEGIEKATIQQALRKHDGNLSKAAAELGFGRSTLYRKLDKYGL